MKKVIIILAAALLSAWSANAQIGVIAGLTSSATNVESAYADIKNVNQYHVGLAYRLSLGRSLAIQPALIYNMKGTTMGNIAGVQDVDVEYKTGYLELPVQAQFSLVDLGIARAYGLVEPFIGYAVKNEIKSVNQVVDNWDNMKTRFEYGVSLGAGVEVFERLQVSVKYFWNLGDVYGKSINIGTISKEISSSKCDGIAASVAYFF